MAPFEPATWSWWIWALYAWAALYTVWFVYYFVKFERLEREALAGGGPAVARFNRALKGAPAAMYAKMLGKVPLDEQDST
ncbi:MAG: hypothetical protein ACPGQL_02230 [Thermoplasmatota archaeon]